MVNKDIPRLRDFSQFFYRTNGIYQKVVNYYATMYRYDWYMTPEVLVKKEPKEEDIKLDFIKALSFYDRSNIKKICQDFALYVLRDGVYYGYIYNGTDGVIVQDLPWQWCRSRYKIGGMPAVEFNMKYFDTKYLDVGYRLKVLDLFPPEFKKGYLLYKQGKLPNDELQTSKGGYWYLLDPACAVKFSIFGTNDLPLFINAIPEIMDLGVAQGVDRQRQLQQLLKIFVQKLPLDKNGDLIFDIDEARDIHKNAVEMLANAIGVDVITTFADVEAIDVSDASSLAKDTTLENAKNAVFNALGVSSNLFNTTGNLALTYSIAADEGNMRDLLYQFEIFLNKLAGGLSSNSKKWRFRFYLLNTTQYNYQAISKLYKEQTQLGFSKMLPQIALGQTQSFILNSINFENNVLHLSEIMIPPLMSSTMSGEELRNLQTNRSLGKTNQNQSDKTEKKAGRPEKDENELTEKTIQNKESMS